MPRKATTALAALLVFGAASVVCADVNNRIDGSFAQRPVSIVSNGRTGAVNDTAKSFTTEERLRSPQHSSPRTWWHRTRLGSN
jgi:hypothetical protein